MKKYLSFFKIRFSNGLQYRVAAYAGVITQFAWGIMEILMFKAFYKANPTAFPMGFSQLSSYIWLKQAFIALFMLWFWEEDIFSAVSSGNVAYELIRPMDLYNMWFMKNMASRLSKAVLRCIPILIIAALIPQPYGISLPNDFLSFFSFIISMILAFLVVVSFCMMIYITTFYTLSPLGIKVIFIALVEFLSGSIIPIPFLPDKIASILEILPFASMQNMPLRIYSGNIAGMDMLYAILLQVFWLVVLVVVGKVFMKKSLKKVVIQGG